MTHWEREPAAGRGAWIRNADTKEWVALACGDTDESAQRHAAMITAAPRMLAALKAMILNDQHTYRDCHKAAVAIIAELEPS